ncbi:ABC1 family-domain-containing protein [Kickxella alabastrina]|uniref:ABC1 family-domain-containing protein n=1 Tax=Kickxella alabastrina TaxID=61397 RepID=UPI002220831C|nr:ABC1 family-domain-containing protein [Kickxella alabastrina]KAI7830817.1 ABC1 family-domain-containing protein [Kickxella alabastrina]
MLAKRRPTDNGSASSNIISPKPTEISERSEALAAPQGFLTRIWRTAAVAADGSWELLLTVVRSGQILLYFLPLLATYPAVYLGRWQADRGARSGALWWYAFLRAQLSRGGPTFVKLAQWAASRTDLFSAALCLELGRLHDNNRAHAAEYSRRTVAHALGVADVRVVFDQWEDRPLGVGAVAQVHYARLRPEFAQGIASGDVAVKVLHPGVQRLIARDLRIMRWGARLLGYLPGMRWLSLPEEVAVFGAMMQAQVDLRTEAHNLQRFVRNFAHRPGVTFPRAYPDLSSAQVLVESHFDGIPLRAFLDSPGHSMFDRRLGARGLDAFLHMLIYDNFVHADLHPGNILVDLRPPEPVTPLDRFVEDFYDMSPFAKSRAQEPLPTGAEAHAHRIHAYMEFLWANGFSPSLGFLDCGLVTSLDADNRRNFIDLFEAVCTFNGTRAGTLMIDRCLTPDQVVDKDVFVLRIQDIILKVRQVSFQLSKLTFTEIFSPVMDAVRMHHVRLAPDFINIIMAMFILEGIGRRLDPDSDILRVALPMLRTWLKEDAQNELAWQHIKGGKTADTAAVAETYRARSWNLYKVWIYVEFREYFDRIKNWGLDDGEFFGEFAPFVTADSSLA